MTATFTIGDVYYQAQLYRHGRGLDYDCPPRQTRDEAENDLAESLAMMSERERDQSVIESYIGAFRVLDLCEDGTIGTAESV